MAKKKLTAAQLARKEAQAAQAKAEELQARLDEMTKKMKEKSGRKSDERTRKHKKSSRKSSESDRPSRKSSEPTPSKKRKEAPTSDADAAKKSRNSDKNQGHSDKEQPQTALETTVSNLLEAKRRYGGRRSSSKNGTPDEMLTRISTAIKNQSFDTFKYVLGEKGKAKLVENILDHLKMDGYYGQDKSSGEQKTRIQRNRANFLELYGDECIQALNSVRSSTSTEIKKAARAWYDAHDHTLPTFEQLERLIGRDLSFEDAEHVELFEWYQMNLIPKAVGSAANWNKSKREYNCLSTGAPIKSKKPYISPETEAYAVLQLKGNHGRWQKQFQVADHPDYRGRIQRILGRKKEGEDDGLIQKHWIMDQPVTAKAKLPTAKAQTAHTKAKIAATKAKVKKNDPKAAEEEAQQNGKQVATTTRTSRRKAPKETEEGDGENEEEETKEGQHQRRGSGQQDCTRRELFFSYSSVLAAAAKRRKEKGQEEVLTSSSSSTGSFVHQWSFFFFFCASATTTTTTTTTTRRY